MTASNLNIVVHINEQLLNVYDDKDLLKSYAVCTAKNGVGEQMGSECTPRGAHVIRAKIGDREPLGRVFVGRRSTGEIYQIDDLKMHEGLQFHANVAGSYGDDFSLRQLVLHIEYFGAL